MEFKYVAILVCAILLAFLLYKEVAKPNKARLTFRILASIIAVTCFALIIIPIKYNTYLKQNTSEIILLTDGTHADSVAKLTVEKYQLTDLQLKNVKATTIPDLSYFLATHPTIKTINIYGFGLSKSELKSLKGYQVNFHPNINPTGIITANWPNQIKTTQQIIVQGIFQNSGDQKIKLLLKGLGRSIDSISIEPNAKKQFSFKTQPKHIGKAVFNLISFNDKDTLSNEPVPFQVSEELPMKVLILASFPDFEYKFLKKWLYENQYPLAFRSQISKNKYSTDFLNLDSLNLNRINATSLKKFDILIIDEEELAAISAEQRNAINAAVNNGMGLLVRANQAKASTSLSNIFQRFEASPSKDKQLSLVMDGDQFKFTKLPIEQKLFLRSGSNDQPIVSDGSKKTLVNSTIKGNGKILISTISATYNWLLSGKANDYATFWSEILNNAARKKSTIQSLHVAPQFASENEKVNLTVDLLEAAKTPAMKLGNINLAPQQNMELPFQWNAAYWPASTGWMNLLVNQSKESFYIYKKSDWLALKNQDKINSNLQFIKNAKNNSTKITSNNITIEKEVSILWFFAGFLLASAFLWLESRISSNN